MLGSAIPEPDQALHVWVLNRASTLDTHRPNNNLIMPGQPELLIMHGQAVLSTLRVQGLDQRVVRDVLMALAEGFLLLQLPELGQADYLICIKSRF